MDEMRRKEYEGAIMRELVLDGKNGKGRNFADTRDFGGLWSRNPIRAEEKENHSS
jgi:hypothetical protein